MKQTKTMKQTAITISMINQQGMNRTEGQTLRAVDGEQRMTSMEIAELTGKNHFDVLRAIRKMEPAWEKITECKFAVSEYKDSTGRTLPCYSLTKTECLYYAKYFEPIENATLVTPRKYHINPQFLEWHRDCIFNK